MLLDKTLCITVLISLVFHLSIFLPFPFTRRPLVKEPLPSLKVTYLTPRVLPAEVIPVKEAPILKATPQQMKEETVLKGFERDKSPKIEKELAKKIAKLPQPKGQHSQVVIPPELPKEQEALYLNYYQSVREKIRKLVVHNYPRFIACGEVCLYFVLLPNGKLREIRVVEERSCQNRLLKEVAQKSIIEASPFSTFPQGLNQPQLSFNVIISFEAEN